MYNTETSQFEDDGATTTSGLESIRQTANIKETENSKLSTEQWKDMYTAAGEDATKKKIVQTAYQSEIKNKFAAATTVDALKTEAEKRLGNNELLSDELKSSLTSGLEVKLKDPANKCTVKLTDKTVSVEEKKE